MILLSKEWSQYGAKRTPTRVTSVARALAGVRRGGPRDLPLGEAAYQAVEMHATRFERDSMGEIAVPEARLWGAETARSLHYFQISDERMPSGVILALAYIKRAAAQVHAELGLLPQPIADAICSAADEVIAGVHSAEFPLSVWQTGSGTQTHMNMNEVLANRASELLGGPRGEGRVVNAHDHVNRGQSSNDVFSAAMNIAARSSLEGAVAPSLTRLIEALSQKALRFESIVKMGRTHLQDATPLTLGQEFSGWVSQLEHSLQHLNAALPHLSELAVGGTAVGTGLNTHPEFARRMAAQLSLDLGLAYVSSPNKFEALSAHDALVFAHSALKTLAVALLKIAGDVRWLVSGPRAGIGELMIPANEPGSSIMPGKVNPTQCEALTMCCLRVLGNDTSVAFAGASGNFQLNVCKPLMIECFLQSARLLADGMESFRTHLVTGIEPNRARIREHLNASLMLVTVLSPHLGYEKAAAIAQLAHTENLTLEQAALKSGQVTREQFAEWVRPEDMIGPR